MDLPRIFVMIWRHLPESLRVQQVVAKCAGYYCMTATSESPPMTLFRCGTCQQEFSVDAVYEEGGSYICQKCFALRTRPIPSAPAPQNWPTGYETVLHEIARQNIKIANTLDRIKFWVTICGVSVVGYALTILGIFAEIFSHQSLY